MNTEIFEQLMKLSPPLLMALLINFVIWGLRLVPRYPDWLSPIIAMILGGALYPLLTDPGKVLFAVRSPLAAQIITGITAGGLAVAFNQQFKQWIKKFGGSVGDTEILQKDDYEKAVKNSPPDNPVGGPI